MVSHLEEITVRFPMESNQPAFSYIEKGKVKCVTYQGFTKELKHLLSSFLGIPSDGEERPIFTVLELIHL